jgi:hypothetical protein
LLFRPTASPVGITAFTCNSPLTRSGAAPAYSIFAGEPPMLTEICRTDPAAAGNTR